MLFSYTGDAGNSLMYTGDSNWIHNGMKFTTYDADHDLCTDCSVCTACGEGPGTRGGWWYNNCFMACLTCQGTSMEWGTLDTAFTGKEKLMHARMMMKQTEDNYY